MNDKQFTREDVIKILNKIRHEITNCSRDNCIECKAEKCMVENRYINTIINEKISLLNLKID